MRYSSKWPVYAKQWDGMNVKAARKAEFDKIAKRLIAHKAEYQEIEKATGVPWAMIAVLHLRESNADFKTYLGNGQSLGKRTTIVPKGRGPFKTFKDGAIDALKIDGLSAVKDWRLEKVLYHSELYNGAGYDMRGLPSPYIWGGTDRQRPGTYVADGTWNGRVMDTQPGVAPILQAMMEIDPSINFSRET
jgi:lysozyme family protein